MLFVQIIRNVRFAQQQVLGVIVPVSAPITLGLISRDVTRAGQMRNGCMFGGSGGEGGVMITSPARVLRSAV